ncbi:MAG TPA: Fic family protein [Methanocorpusculum sp.]|nr:Fic family protein [Methanocorpusculum sp.]
MHIFDYSFLENGSVPSNILNLTASLYSERTLTDTRKSASAQVFSELELIAKVQSVKSSNAIEGIVTSDERIRDIVTNSSAPLNHDEADIAGYRDVLNLVHTHYAEISFDVSTILSFHALLLSKSGYEYGGKFKSENNLIMERSADGTRQVRFTPTPASETKGAVEQLVFAYLEARDNANINQLLLIPCVILDFLCIHPFRDGNGRISRLLSLLLLYKNGFDIGKWISYEEKINETKDEYYAALKASSEGWHENKNNPFVFMEYFMRTLLFCYDDFDRRFVSAGSSRKGERVELVLMRSVVPLSKADICRSLPEVSLTTVEAVLGRMVKEGKILKTGAARSTRYVWVG